MELILHQSFTLKTITRTRMVKKSVKTVTNLAHNNQITTLHDFDALFQVWITYFLTFVEFYLQAALFS